MESWQPVMMMGEMEEAGYQLLKNMATILLNQNPGSFLFGGFISTHLKNII